jgi:RNA polymerase sigma factor (sigma-70 family)
MDNFDEIRAMFTTYIERVAGYARQEYLRTLRYRAREVSLAELPEEKLSHSDDGLLPDEFAFEVDRLSQAITDLPALRKQVLVLAFIHQLTAPEIAARLGCTVDYIYKQKHLALQKLKATMEGDCHGQ